MSGLSSCFEKSLDSLGLFADSKNIIAIEGIDGSGKSTQAELLRKRMCENNIKCVLTNEPSGGEIGSLIREVLAGKSNVDPRVLAHLFAADRLDHLLNSQSDVNLEMSKNTFFIIDRYYLSSFAYQTDAFGLELLAALNAVALRFFKPLCHVFIDVSPKTALNRIRLRGSDRDLYENEQTLIKIRESYLEVFDRLSAEENIVVIDGSRDISCVSDDIWSRLKDFLIAKPE